MRNLILVICTIQLVYGAPQMITFKDGKVGVNFAGYSASAGLGGLLTGDASHGFLSASAGTPNGQHASAGLGGDLNNQASGIAYANAQATPNKKTGVVLSGSTSGKHDVHVTIPSNSNEIVTENVPVSVIQRIKPPKKYHLLKPQSAENEGKTVYTKSFSKSAHAVPSHPTEDYPNQGPVIQPSIVQRALGIPIGILQSLQQSLSGLGHAQKTVSFSHY